MSKTRPLATFAIAGLGAALVMSGGAAHAAPGGTPQASITLKTADMDFCHKQEAGWTLTKTSDQPLSTVMPGTTVTWTVTATKDTSAPARICATGLFAVTNTGSAPATIGNIVVNLQRQRAVNGKSRWISTAADVADATSGAAATRAEIVAAASQEDPSANATYGPGNYQVVGTRGIFAETAASGALEFTDSSDNTLWAITPQRTIAVGETINLYFDAVFDSSLLSVSPGELLRTEVIVSFGNSGARGGSGASASNIDINGNGTIDRDEASVRSVPSRTTQALPALQICNDSVTLTDELSASETASVAVLQDDIGSGVTVNATRSFSLRATLGGVGTVTNQAILAGSDTVVAIQIGTAADGTAILVERPCCRAAYLTASDSVTIDDPPGFEDGDYCTYTQGAYGQPPGASGLPAGFPGRLLWNNFAAAYPTGVEVGLAGAFGYSMRMTSASAVAAYLPAAGPPGALTADLTNPLSTSSGIFGGQVLTLQINVDFSDGGVTSNATGALGDLRFVNLTAGSALGTWILDAAEASALNGLAVRDVLNGARTALGGGALPGYVGTFGDLNQLVTWLNLAFDNCLVTADASSYLTRAPG